MVVIGAFCLTVGYAAGVTDVRFDTVGIWVGLLCLLNAAPALFAISAPASRQCLILINLTLSIVIIVLCIGLICISEY